MGSSDELRRKELDRIQAYRTYSNAQLVNVLARMGTYSTNDALVGIALSRILEWIVKHEQREEAEAAYWRRKLEDELGSAQ